MNYDPKISYIISTKNRLSFLKVLKSNIFSDIQSNEEIVVVDGNSTDGSKEYLQDLFDKGIIHQFVSEPDRNQAEGWNKAILLARGQIIKKIIDDDVFDLAAIRKCTDWMISHPEVDLCISDCLQANLNQPGYITKASRLPFFQDWKNKTVKSFSFSDVYLLIRKNALPRLGLFDMQFRMLDWEYSLRCSYLQATIAYYTGCVALAVATPGNITSTSDKETLKREGKIGEIKYEYAGDRAHISFISEVKIFIGKRLNNLGLRKPRQSEFITIEATSEEHLDQIYLSFYAKLKEYNSTQHFEILY